MNFQVHDILANPVLLREVPDVTLQAWIKQYPYVSLFQLYALKKKGRYNEHDLHHTAFYFNNREKLYFLLNDKSERLRPVYDRNAPRKEIQKEEFPISHSYKEKIKEIIPETFPQDFKQEVIESRQSTVDSQQLNEIVSKPIEETVDSGLSIVDKITEEVFPESHPIVEEKTETFPEDFTQQVETSTTDHFIETVVEPEKEVEQSVNEEVADKPMSTADKVLADLLKMREEREKRRLGIYEEEKEEPLTEDMQQELEAETEIEISEETKEVEETIEEEVSPEEFPESLGYKDEIPEEILPETFPEDFKQEVETVQLTEQPEIVEETETKEEIQEPQEEIKAAIEEPVKEVVEEKRVSMADQMLAEILKRKEERELRRLGIWKEEETPVEEKIETETHPEEVKEEETVAETEKKEEKVEEEKKQEEVETVSETETPSEEVKEEEETNEEEKQEEKIVSKTDEKKEEEVVQPGTEEVKETKEQEETVRADTEQESKETETVEEEEEVAEPVAEKKEEEKKEILPPIHEIPKPVHHTKLPEEKPLTIAEQILMAIQKLNEDRLHKKFIEDDHETRAKQTVDEGLSKLDVVGPFSEEVEQPVDTHSSVDPENVIETEEEKETELVEAEKEEEVETTETTPVLKAEDSDVLSQLAPVYPTKEEEKEIELIEDIESKDEDVFSELKPVDETVDTRSSAYQQNVDDVEEEEKLETETADHSSLHIDTTLKPDTSLFIPNVEEDVVEEHIEPEVTTDKETPVSNEYQHADIHRNLELGEFQHQPIRSIDDASKKEPHTFLEWLQFIDGGLNVQTTEQQPVVKVEKEWIEIPQYELSIQQEIRQQAIAAPPKEQKTDDQNKKLFEPNFDEGEVDLFQEIDEAVTKVASESVSFKNDMMTETLAKIYTKQGKTDKALEIYNALRLKFPEKSAYFAALIQKIQNKE